MNGTYKAVIVLVYLIATPTYAQSVVRLICKGELSTTIDFKTEKKPLLLDVSINLQEGSMKIPGYWGCIGDLGNRERTNDSCTETFPIKIKDDEYLYYTDSDGNDYRASTSLRLNRYSGILMVSGLANSKPPAGAQWLILMTDSKLSCSVMNRPLF